ncbi:MAG: Hsp33 family molecular chaperone HslO, partial [Kangiellaceae bacterium]|nr:Hsp33 family molecular chaperone HslO [Kangiellaceae bacterium]
NSPATDFIQRFLFEEHAVRGHWIKLEKTLVELLNGHDYPASVEKQLFEAALATNLLTETIKFEGRLSLQIQSGGALSLILVQADHQHQFRGIARHQTSVPDSDDLKELMPGAQMALTIEPNLGKRYQGIVPMHQHNLSDNLADYFRQSEQLATQLWLFSDHNSAAGLFLQAMPESDQHQTERADFDHLAHLAATLSAEEALSLDAETVLHRLFHQEPLRLFPAEPIRFNCGCSRQKSLASLTLVPKAELEEMLEQQGKVAMNCEFCQTHYEFDSIDIAQIFANSGLDMQQNTEQ